MQAIKQILKWVENYFATVMCISVGLFCFYDQLTRPNLDSKDDILQIEGQVSNYSFKRIPRTRARQRVTLKEYYIWLDNYPCTFQIKADFLSFFFQSSFENDVRKGDNLRLTIPKEQKNQLYISSNNIFILSASKNSTDYLSLKDTIPIENDNFGIYAGLFFFTSGLLYYILKWKKFIK